MAEQAIFGQVLNLLSTGFISWQPHGAVEMLRFRGWSMARYKKTPWRALRVPPADRHWCVGLAPCLLRGLSSAKRTVCVCPRVTRTLSSADLAARVQRVLCAWVPLFACLVAVLWGLSPWLWDHMPPKPFLDPSDLRNLWVCCNGEILSSFHVGMEDYTEIIVTSSTSRVNAATLSRYRIYLTL